MHHAGGGVGHPHMLLLPSSGVVIVLSLQVVLLLGMMDRFWLRGRCDRLLLAGRFTAILGAAGHMGGPVGRLAPFPI